MEKPAEKVHSGGEHEKGSLPGKREVLGDDLKAKLRI